VRALVECSFREGHSECVVDHTCTVCLSTVLTYPPLWLTCMVNTSRSDRDQRQLALYLSVDVQVARLTCRLQA
jgi:hypothetical protein